MTDRAEALRALLADVQAGNFPGELTGPQMGFPDTYAAVLHEAFSLSLDAALALHKAVLPGRNWGLGGPVYGEFCCEIFDEMNEVIDVGINSCPAHAWLIAIIRALLAEIAAPTQADVEDT